MLQVNFVCSYSTLIYFIYRMYVFDEENKCFGEIDSVKFPWGSGNGDLVLSVFSSIGIMTSVASNLRRIL